MHSSHIELIEKKTYQFADCFCLHFFFLAPTLEGDDKIFPLFHQTHNHQQGVRLSSAGKARFCRAPFFADWVWEEPKSRAPSLFGKHLLWKMLGLKAECCSFPARTRDEHHHHRLPSTTTKSTSLWVSRTCLFSVSVRVDMLGRLGCGEYINCNLLPLWALEWLGLADNENCRLLYVSR